MDGMRRSFDRSRELAPSNKKPRLAEDLAQGFPMRAVAGGQGQQRYRNADGVGGGNDDGSREAYQPQPLPPHQQHRELVEQYKAALSELTFNSKPIITNLTIIAGENLPAAKVIAATVCSNIIEVPNDQKLPSLYLLDSIVKNIGRDYIKHFASKLPEVFCATYRQVDPVVHNSMRHLFGTWKGVFLPQTLQMIERELGFGNAGNGSLGSSTSTPDSQSQRPSHSIHVNPKYLELQRLQTRTSQLAQRNLLGDSVHGTNDDGVIYDDYNMGSNLSRTSDLGVGRTSGRSDQRQGRPYVSADTDAPSTIQCNGFPAKLGASGYPVPKLTSLDSYSQSTVAGRIGSGISDNWKNSEEEEYMWDTVDPRLRDHDTNIIANARKDSWVQRDPEGMNLEGSLKPTPKGGLQLSVETSNLRLSEDHSARDSRVSSGVSTFRGMAARSQMKPSVSAISRSAGSQRFPATGSLLQSRQSKLQTLGNLSEEEFLQSDDLPEGRTSSLSGRSRPLPSKRYNQDASAKLRPQTLRPSHSSAPAQPRKRPLSQQLRSAPESLGLETKPPLPQVTDHENVSKSRSVSSLSLAEELSIPANEIDRNIQMVNRSSGAFVPEQSKQTKSPPSFDPSSGSTLKPAFSSDPNIAENSTSNVVDNETKQSSSTSRSAPSPVLSLLSTLVAKGLISAVKTESSVPEVPVQLPKQRKDDTPSRLASTPSPSSSTVGEAPASKSSCELPRSSSNELPKSIIGFEFKPSAIRELNDAVINQLLEEFPYRCSICGSSFKHDRLLNKHLRWHAIRNPDQENELSSSRGWYANSDDWVAGKTMLQLDSECTTSEGRNDQEPMVWADESQCACILCGELFDDFYCLETNQWMFKGAVYLDISLPNGEIGNCNVNGSPMKGPIVHAGCITDCTLESLGLAKSVKRENDEVMQDD